LRFVLKFNSKLWHFFCHRFV